MNGDGHRAMREMLGAYVLGHLPEHDVAEVRAHLSTCGACQAEVAELEPLATPLRLADPARLDAAAPTAGESPPDDLGDRIARRVAREGRQQRRWQLRRRAYVGGLTGAVAVVAGVTGFGIGVALRSPAPPPVPLEPVAVQVFVPGVDATANLVNHTWGVEIKLTGSGFAPGQTYRAFVQDEQGRTVSAGSFVGTGDATLKCNLNSSVLRADAAGFVVRDAQGASVVSSTLPPR